MSEPLASRRRAGGARPRIGWPRWTRWRRFLSRLTLRLLAFNLLLVFVPLAGLLYFDVYEEQLLELQERSMVQQGRSLAAALATGELDEAAAKAVLEALRQRQDARLRVVDADGRLLADSSLLGPQLPPGEAAEVPAPPALENPLYRAGSFLFRLLRRLGGHEAPPPERSPGTPAGSGALPPAPDPLPPEAVEAALDGRYGAATRVSEGQRSLTLFSAIPIVRDGAVEGAVVVSQSTLRVLGALYEVRLGIFRVFLASLVAAVALSLLLATTIARPIRRLRREAQDLVDRRGRLRGRFRASAKLDEIGDLSRALEELTRRLESHLHFTESFASDVSHQFKNPLAAIRTATELLASAEDPEERRRFERLVAREVQRLERLLSGVREISAIDARLDDEPRRTVSLREVATGVVEAHRLRAAGDGQAVRFRLELPQEPVEIAGAPERLAQVLDVLLDNATGFSPPGGTVTVRLEREAEEALLAVEDEGPGIPEENLPRLFDRFFTYRPAGRPGETPPAAGDGSHSGLGLAIARSLVEGHGGGIRAENRSGGGARFVVRLPLAGAEAGEDRSPLSSFGGPSRE